MLFQCLLSPASVSSDSPCCPQIQMHFHFHNSAILYLWASLGLVDESWFLENKISPINVHVQSFFFATVYYYKEPFLHIAMSQSEIIRSEMSAAKGTALSIYVCMFTSFLYTQTLPHAYRYGCIYIYNIFFIHELYDQTCWFKTYVK